MGPQQGEVASCRGTWRRACEIAPQLAAQAELASQRWEQVPAARGGGGVLCAPAPESGSYKAATGTTVHPSCSVAAVFNSSDLTRHSALALCLCLCTQPAVTSVPAVGSGSGSLPA